MKTKDQLIQEIEQVPESRLEEVLDFVRSLKAKQPQELEDRAWQAYLESEQERKEVYQRLADS